MLKRLIGCLDPPNSFRITYPNPKPDKGEVHHIVTLNSLSHVLLEDIKYFISIFFCSRHEYNRMNHQFFCSFQPLFPWKYLHFVSGSVQIRHFYLSWQKSCHFETLGQMTGEFFSSLNSITALSSIPSLLLQNRL